MNGQYTKAILDTRQKILDLAAAARLAEGWRRAGIRWKLVAGYFDLLTPDHTRSLRAIAGAGPLMAAVLDSSESLLPQQARAELAASLRVVDYVLLLGGADLDEALRSLLPDEVIRSTADDLRRTHALIAHVHRRQTS